MHIHLRKTLCIKALVIVLSLSLYGCDSFCIGGTCFMDEPVLKERVYDEDKKYFHIELDRDGEFNSHTFRLGKLETIEQLSFGVHDAHLFRKYTAVKKIHILSNAALNTYRKQYLIPGIGCPASFMNQNLQSMLLIPANEAVAKQLEVYDIPFDGRGTAFKLTGHTMAHDSSYFIDNGKTFTLDLESYESVMSNVGSAQHPLHYFLVTDVNP
jgi:hypothetical protein